MASSPPSEEAIFSEVIDVDENERTTDVLCDGSFKSLMLSPNTLANLSKHGFKRPSPVQLKAIPPGLTGFDMLVQAKSGTGKTLVFSILAVENLNVSSTAVQKLIVAPTREIVGQIVDTITRLAPRFTKVVQLVGGTSLKENHDKLRLGAHIVVGTTGRVCQLVSEGALRLQALTLFVMDEADKMMSESFEKDVNYIFSALPTDPSPQVAVYSATFPPSMATLVGRFLRSPIHVRLCTQDVQLVGIKQYVHLNMGAEPIDAAVACLSKVQFRQAIIYCAKAEQCEDVACAISDKTGHETTSISATLTQVERESVMRRLRGDSLKVLVSTDLTARGVDADKVDLVVNIGPPFTAETYFHRIGRAGRFGGQGASVTILSDRSDVRHFCYLVENAAIAAKLLPPGNRYDAHLVTSRELHDSCAPFVAHGRDDAAGTAKDGPPTTSADATREHVDVDNPDEDTENRAPSRTSNCSADERSSCDEEEKMDYSEMLDKVMNLSESLKKKESSANATGKEESSERESTDAAAGDLPAKPRKFAFVSSRAKKTTKYYMRGEMMDIKNASSPEQWLAYAQTKFNLSEVPFILAEMPCETEGALIPPRKDKKTRTRKPRVEKNQPKQQTLVETNEVEKPCSDRPPTETRAVVVPEVSSPAPDDRVVDETSVVEAKEEGEVAGGHQSDIKTYTRRQMKKIMMRAPNKVWTAYAQSRWDLSQDPFVDEAWKRESFEIKLRVQRQKEKEERQRVLAERTAAQVRLLSIGDTPIAVLPAASLADVKASAVGEDGPRRAGAVPRRRAIMEYHQRIMMAKRAVDNFDRQFEYMVKTRLAGVRETECQTEDVRVVADLEHVQSAFQHLSVEGKGVPPVAGIRDPSENVVKSTDDNREGRGCDEGDEVEEEDDAGEGNWEDEGEEEVYDEEYYEEQEDWREDEEGMEESGRQVQPAIQAGSVTAWQEAYQANHQFALVWKAYLDSVHQFY